MFAFHSFIFVCFNSFMFVFVLRKNCSGLSNVLGIGIGGLVKVNASSVSKIFFPFKSEKSVSDSRSPVPIEKKK